ncbi:MAG: hypothetical protein ABS75_10880 [Pelagibacterium sp. SCN 63-23]|nr:MAG: hypothetical protein ABS75_10880 [Pelagibacterium sp. SCN 63-23]
MTVDDRLEIRITGEEKAALGQRAKAEGIPVSTLMRRGIRAVLQRPGRLEAQDAGAIVALCRRVNSLAARLDTIGANSDEIRALQRDLAQAHADGRSLLER